ncbi:MAG: fibronectin type III domain-containing protein [Bacteroidota bacterium]
MNGELGLVSISSSREVYEFITKDEICPGDPIYGKLGLTAGFEAYQWRKDGNVIPGATSNELVITEYGVYDARFRRNGEWSQWSVRSIELQEKGTTITPDIQVSGFSSVVIPDAAGKDFVDLELPEGYLTYEWQMEGSPTVLSNDRVFRVTQPGNYLAKVTENFGCASDFGNAFQVLDAEVVSTIKNIDVFTANGISKTETQLNWSLTPTGDQVDQIEIYRSTTDENGFELIQILNAGSSSFIDDGLMADQQYLYKLRPVNSVGAGSVSNTKTAITAVDNVPPTAPLNLKVLKTTSSSITVTWDPATDDVGVFKYDVFKSGIKSTVVDDTEATLFGLNENQIYSIQVKARDFAGNESSFSNLAVGAAANSGLFYKYYEGSWNSLPDFNSLAPVLSGLADNFDMEPRLQNDNFSFYFEGYINIPVAGNYTFETRSDDGSKLYIGGYDESNLVVDNDGLHGMRYREGTYNFPNAGKYLITVTFFEKGGGQGLEVYWKNTAHGIGSRQRIPSSAFASDFEIPTVEVLSPEAISTSALSYDQIQIDWTDNNTTESGYQIFRNDPGSQVYLPLGVTAANGESFTDVALEASTTYQYLVIALSDLGPSEEVGSRFSNLGDINSGIGAQDNAIGTGFIMYTSSDVFSRFSANAPNGSNSDHLIAVKYVNDEWVYDNNGGYYPFSPVVTDLLLAEVDFTNDQIISLENNEGDTLGIAKGFNSNNDLEFFANRWNGGNNNGEFTIQGTFFERTKSNTSSSTTLELPDTPSEIQNFSATAISTSDVQLTWDNATGTDEYILYRSLDNNNFLELLIQNNNNAVTDANLAPHTDYYYLLGASNVGGITLSDTILVKTLNNSPEMEDIDDFTIRHSSTFELQLYAEDIDNDSIVFTTQNLPSFATITDYLDGSSLISFAPAEQDQGIYTDIVIQVSDAFGGLNSDTVTLEVNNNFVPTLTGASNVSINEGEQIQITLTAVDEDGEEDLQWNTEGLPGFVTLVPSISGTAILEIIPGYSDQGVYSNIRVYVEDFSGAVADQTFDIVVEDKDPNALVKVNLHQGSVGDASWNNIAGLGSQALNNNLGESTGISFELLTQSWNSFNKGAQTNDNSGILPDAVLKDYYYFGIFGAPETVDLKISGLDPETKYDFSFVGSSSWTGVPDNGSTQFNIGSQSASVSVQDNTSQSANINDIISDTSGEVIITMQKASGTPVGYLNGMTIAPKYGADEIPVAPRNLMAELDEAGVILSWVDAPYNELGFNIYRSEQSEGPYTAINTSIIEANTESFIDQSVSEEVNYYYIITAYNANGESTYSNEASIFVPNTPPTISIQGSTSLFVNQTSDLIVSVSDAPTNIFTTSVSGLPPFADFSPSPSGGVISLNPTVEDIGEYQFTITAEDNNNGVANRIVDLQVTEQLLYTVKLNFSKDHNETGWNNTAKNPNQGDVFENLLTTLSTNSGVSVSLETAFGGAYDEGAITGDNSGIMPDNVLKEYYYFGIYGSPDEVTLKVSGLDYNNKYTFGFVGSSLFSGSGITDNGETIYTIGNKSVSVDVQANTEAMGEISNVTANSAGEVHITISKGTGALVGYINALVINVYEGDPSIFNPSDLVANSVSKSAIELVWTDNSFDETGFEIYRSDNGADGTYNLVGNTDADSANFVDTGLNTGTIYHYKVGAVYGDNTHSEYTNIVEGATIDYYVYVNINGSSSYDAAEPWNNISTTALSGDDFFGFKNDEGQPLGLELNVLTGMTGSNDWGVNTGADLGVYPDLVTQSFYYNNRADAKGEFLLKGLDLSLDYNITFFGSIVTEFDISTIFSANGKSVTNRQTDNISETSTIFGLSPDVNGELLFTVQESPNSIWAIFNAFVLGAYPKSTGPNQPSGGRTSSNVGAGSFEVRYGQSNIALTQYPNPVTDELYLSVQDAPLETLTAQIITTQGVIVNTFTQELSEINSVLDLSELVTNLKQGIYILNLTVKGAHFNYRIIKN